MYQSENRVSFGHENPYLGTKMIQFILCGMVELRPPLDEIDYQWCEHVLQATSDRREFSRLLTEFASDYNWRLALVARDKILALLAEHGQDRFRQEEA